VTNFRASWTHLHVAENAEEVNLPAEFAQALQVSDGDWVRLARL
jgi:arginine N-succinyltransferase